MDIEKFLEDSLNPKSGQIKNKDLFQLLPELKQVLKRKVKGQRIKRRDDLRKILHESLKELGENDEQIKKLSINKNKKRNVKKNISPSFKAYKPFDGSDNYTSKDFYQGGSPGLGKKK